jgi:predicted nucleic acid-binding protein
MSLVIDASVTAAWAFGDEDHPRAVAALEALAGEDGLVPALWWFEVRNVLIVGERRGRIAPGDSERFLRTLGRLPIRVDASPEDASVLALARAHRLSVYDAAYLELAVREWAPLFTLDAALETAARAAGAPMPLP